MSTGHRVAIVVSRFNAVVTDQLLAGAQAALADRGVDNASIVVTRVPGAFELPVVAQRLAASGDFDAIVCLGAVIQGETDHHIHVGGQCAAGLQRVQLDTGVPVVLGVLTTRTLEQALARAGGRSGDHRTDNRGYDVAVAAIETADLLAKLPAGPTDASHAETVMLRPSC